MQTYQVTIRPRRQVTLPKDLLKRWGTGVGDALVISNIDSEKATLKTRKREALDALAEIQRIVRESGVSEAELQEEARRYRLRKWQEEHEAKDIS